MDDRREAYEANMTEEELADFFEMYQPRKLRIKNKEGKEDKKDKKMKKGKKRLSKEERQKLRKAKRNARKGNKGKGRKLEAIDETITTEADNKFLGDSL